MPEQIRFGEVREREAKEQRPPVGPHADGAQGDGISVPGIADRLLHAVLDARASPRVRQRDGEPVHPEDAIRQDARRNARPPAVAVDGSIQRQGQLDEAQAVEIPQVRVVRHHIRERGALRHRRRRASPRSAASQQDGEDAG